MQPFNPLVVLAAAGRGLVSRAPVDARPAETGRELLAVAPLTADEALRQLGSSLAGLTSAEAEARLQRYGLNEVAHERPKSALRRLVELFLTPLSMLLIALSFINYETGEVRGAMVIAVMVVLSSLLSFVQERRSGQAAEKLRAMVSTTATVTRQREAAGSDGATPTDPAERAEIALAHVVPGDIVHLSAGDILPADVRVLAARDLFVNQASLTGESLPVEKFPSPVTQGRSALELSNVAFMGSNVVSGTATAVVVTTGPQTYFGSVASSVTAQQETTSFDRGVTRFIWLIIALHGGDGAARVPGQRAHEGRLAGSVPVRGGRGGRPHARNAADDRDDQSRQGRDRDGGEEGHRQAPERDPEPRRHGRAVHRQDRDADPGQGAAGAPRRRVRRGVRAGAGVRLPQQLLPDRSQEPAGRGGAGARRGPCPAAPLRQVRQGRRGPVRLPAPPHVGGGRREGGPPHPHLQGRGGRGLQRLRPRRPAWRSGRARGRAPRERTGGDAQSSTRRGSASSPSPPRSCRPDRRPTRSPTRRTSSSPATWRSSILPRNRPPRRSACCATTG